MKYSSFEIFMSASAQYHKKGLKNCVMRKPKIMRRKPIIILILGGIGTLVFMATMGILGCCGIHGDTFVFMRQSWDTLGC